MRFIDAEHKKFFEKAKQSCGGRKEKLALVYLLGLTEQTRERWSECYNVQRGTIKPEVLSAAWQTSTTRRVLTLAFDLWGWKSEKQYSVCALFANHSLYPYLVQAMDIRFGVQSRREGTGRPADYGAEDAARIRAAHENGMSIRKIAEHEDMSTATVQKLLKMTSK